MLSRFERVAIVLARVVGLGFGALGAFETARVVRDGLGGGVVLALGLVVLSVGCWSLRPLALRFATGLLVFFAIVTPVGLINPFRAMDAGARVRMDDGFVARAIAMGLGIGLACLLLAYCISQARLAVVRARSDGPR